MLLPLSRRSHRRYRIAHPSSGISLPRKGSRVGLRIVLFETCSAFTRVTACTLALSPIRDSLSEGFSHFVTSMTAPVASGWSICRAGFSPTGKRRLFTAHTLSGRRPKARADVQRRGSLDRVRTCVLAPLKLGTRMPGSGTYAYPFCLDVLPMPGLKVFVGSQRM
jgi:hypothetical protein